MGRCPGNRETQLSEGYMHQCSFTCYGVSREQGRERGRGRGGREGRGGGGGGGGGEGEGLRMSHRMFTARSSYALALTSNRSTHSLVERVST